MKTLFKYQDRLEVIANWVQELVANVTKTQKSVHKEENEKDYKVMYSK